MINRRGLITGLISLVAAPAIIRPSLLMPIKVIKPVKIFTLVDYQNMLDAIMNERIREFEKQIADQILYGTEGINYFDGFSYLVKDRNVRI